MGLSMQFCYYVGVELHEWSVVTSTHELHDSSHLRNIHHLKINKKSLLRYVRLLSSQFRMSSVCLSSVTWDVGAPYSYGWTFRQYFARRCSIGIWRPWRQTLQTWSDAPTLTEASNAGGVWENCDFRLISCFISEPIQTRAVVTMEYE